MELGRQLLAKMRKKKKTDHTCLLGPKGLEVHFYTPASQPLIKFRGCHTVEELCIECAKQFGISPLCQSLYALYDEEKAMWYPPNHQFKADGASQKLYYRQRFYFANWHGLHQNKQAITRHCLKQMPPTGTAILDAPSLAYLYAQSQHDFVHGMAPVRSAQDIADGRNIENECLGMAVLSVSHDSIDRENSDIASPALKISYKRHIPESLKQSISQRNLFIRLRISNVFKRFFEQFSKMTVKERAVTQLDLKLKYIATLETLTEAFGSELFEPVSLRTSDGKGNAEGQPLKQPIRYQVLVSGTVGIQWRLKPAESEMLLKEKFDSKKNKKECLLKKEKVKDDQGWTLFSDFYEITHIIIQESLVTIHKRDHKEMELDLEKHEKALSFTTLVDGYFRLTADAHHFLCREVAPPSVELNILEGCHGPICTEYAIHKLQGEGARKGNYVLRWSSTDNEHILLTIACSEDSERKKSYKNFQITKDGDMFVLDGTEMRHGSLRVLMDQLEGQQLRSDSITLQLTRGFPPEPKEISNLLIATRAHEEENISNNLVFHKILKEDLIQKEHMGNGTKTSIYGGVLKVYEEDDCLSNQEVKVVLKVLNAGHRDTMSDFLETVSMMRQVSHRHIALLYGICIRNQDILMVEEFLQYGPVDIFMSKNSSSLTPDWKFQVAKQLASALSYLEDKKLVHGFVCAKNILLARDGVERSLPFMKLSGPGVPSTSLSREERLDRIPWIAPECVEHQQVVNMAADKWGFGITMWEICHNGERPLKGKTLIEKERFYAAKGQLVSNQASQLADLMTKCMNYEPKQRPSARDLSRDLSWIEMKDPTIVTQEMPGVLDPTVFDKRFLKKIRDLGEGHFGKVELCLYDPHDDHTGEQVAVKSLKTEGESGEGVNLLQEINTMRELYHQNIVKYKGVCTEGGGQIFKLIMEYLPMGSLKDFMHNHRLQISHKHQLLYAKQICEGMVYLGSQNYIHRDLAARNVLVESANLVKIGDFGLTKSIKNTTANYYRVREEQDSPIYWYAPECLVDRKFFTASDVWSFGVTLFEIMTYCAVKQSPPVMYSQIIGPAIGQMVMTRLVENLQKGRRLPCPAACPGTVYTLMKRCWELEPQDRIDFQGLIRELDILLSQLDQPLSP
ncbi:tyrosine-protein kinase JAK1-like [Engraulis encrasicolus]|uniref:tyrosine-protein kinase JAK1-like n=1 Tax=Engraulis encrasicolus TaxID=184585 RepID=UPI002FD22109